MRVSRPGVLVLALSFAAGVATGGLLWQQARDEAPLQKTGVATANIAHIVVALMAGVVMFTNRRRLAPFLVTPFTDAWWRSMGASLRWSPHTLRRLRGIGVRVVLLGAVLYCPYRAGIQVLAGLNRNWTLNAWGGPSYIGAIAAHWMDSILLFYGLTALLSALNRQRVRPVVSASP